MYPPQFDYYRAASLDDALALIQQHPEAKWLAGGHSLLPVMKLRLADPGALIDIGRIPGLNAIEADGKSWTIGALTTHAAVAAHPYLPEMVREAAGLIGDPQVRNRGTLGGNIAHADPASDWPTLLVCLDAAVHTVGPRGKRVTSAEAFFTGLFETALRDGELATAVSWDIWGAGTGTAYEKLSNPASRYAMVGAAAMVLLDRGVATRVRVAVGGLTPHATRCRSVETALTGMRATPEQIAAAAAQVTADLGDDLIGDIHASAEYRRAVCPAIVRRALEKAVARAG